MWKFALPLILVTIGLGQSASTPPGASDHGRPAVIRSSDLDGFEALAEPRRKLIETALGVARDSPWLRYVPAGSTPSDGGFDCSGAMYFVLRKAGLEPPRTAANQREWVRGRSELHEPPDDATSLDHPSLASLRPGDLLFWGHPEAEPPRVSHVAMYLGKEKKDDRPVMINSTDGRSYRGVKANGYGVYDFRLPGPGSKTRFMGYGSPPGLDGKS
ncbi:MAG: C40 family peptidase [Akkermansiaceae bacterium]|nr:C40 family peptidase [Akkermansiaceae bacterium]MCP5544135.1 C40 family peptidase [Akkermansiaceae bacterium]MCP5547809.1 C40 family peptidase [Akkermansiaceae bacterium]